MCNGRVSLGRRGRGCAGSRSKGPRGALRDPSRGPKEGIELWYRAGGWGGTGRGEGAPWARSDREGRGRSWSRGVQRRGFFTTGRGAAVGGESRTEGPLSPTPNRPPRLRGSGRPRLAPHRSVPGGGSGGSAPLGAGGPAAPRGREGLERVPACARVCVCGGGRWGGGRGRTWRRERAPGGGGALAADSLPLSAAGKGAGLPVFVGDCGAWRRCGSARTLYVEVKATETLLRCWEGGGAEPRVRLFGFQILWHGTLCPAGSAPRFPPLQSCLL